jgi:hypothetical protein
MRRSQILTVPSAPPVSTCRPPGAYTAAVTLHVKGRVVFWCREDGPLALLGSISNRESPIPWGVGWEPAGVPHGRGPAPAALLQPGQADSVPLTKVAGRSSRVATSGGLCTRGGCRRCASGMVLLGLRHGTSAERINAARFTRMVRDARTGSATGKYKKGCGSHELLAH